MDPFDNTSIGFLEPADLSDKDNQTVITISQENPDVLYLLMVYANWCGPCKMAKPYYAELSRFLDKEKMDNIRLLAINTTGTLASEKNWGSIAKDKLGVTGYPTILIVSGGKVVGRHEQSRDMVGFLKTLITHGDKHSYATQLKPKLEHFKAFKKI